MKSKAIKAYPNHAGSKETGGTSEQAANQINQKAATIRSRVMNLMLAKGSMTPEDASEQLGYSILAVRPRFSELKLKGKIYKTSATKLNENGKNVRVWAAII
jgi:phage tail tape-measure protein